MSSSEKKGLVQKMLPFGNAPEKENGQKKKESVNGAQKKKVVSSKYFSGENSHNGVQTTLFGGLVKPKKTKKAPKCEEGAPQERKKRKPHVVCVEESENEDEVVESSLSSDENDGGLADPSYQCSVRRRRSEVPSSSSNQERSLRSTRRSRRESAPPSVTVAPRKKKRVSVRCAPLPKLMSLHDAIVNRSLQQNSMGRFVHNLSHRIVRCGPLQQQHSFCYNGEKKFMPYTLCVSEVGNMFAAAGGGGIVALFPLAGKSKNRVYENGEGDEVEDEVVAPHLVIQPHQRWVSDVCFTSFTDGPASQITPPTHMLSSSDDGTIAVHNIAQFLENQHERQCYHDCEEEEVHWNSLGMSTQPALRFNAMHDEGIYSMDVAGLQVLSSAKDATISVTTLTSAGVSGSVLYSNHHTGVIKCARFSKHSPCMFASTGNDRLVNVYDRRVSNPLVLSYEDTHTLSVNHVSWDAGFQHRLCSSSFDQTINVYDIRKPSGPLHKLSAHKYTLEPRATSMYHPAYALHNNMIATAGSKSPYIFMYDATTGDLCGKMKVGFTPSLLCPMPNTLSFLLGNKKKISLYTPPPL